MCTRKVAYLAKFHHNEDDSYTVTFPDFEGCITEGKDAKEAYDMAGKALKQWLKHLHDEDIEIPAGVTNLELSTNETGHWISVTVEVA